MSEQKERKAKKTNQCTGLLPSKVSVSVLKTGVMVLERTVNCMHILSGTLPQLVMHNLGF